MYNLDREKIIIFILAVPLGILSLFLMSLESGLFAFGADQNYKTETIYERRECGDCKCIDAGRRLMTFKGPDASCENYSTEEERMLCYNQNSHQTYACDNLTGAALEQCKEKFSGADFNYYQGGAGTLVLNNSLTVNGSRIYMEGFDCRGEHVIKTGTDKNTSNAMTFRENNRDVEYGGNIDVYGNIGVLSDQGGVYFNAETEYETMEMSNGRTGQGLASYNTASGINLNACGDMKFTAGNEDRLLITGDNRPSFGDLEINGGLDINGDMRSDYMSIMGGILKWTQPIRGNFVLYFGGGARTSPGCTDQYRTIQKDAVGECSGPKGIADIKIWRGGANINSWPANQSITASYNGDRVSFDGFNDYGWSGDGRQCSTLYLVFMENNTWIAQQAGHLNCGTNSINLVSRVENDNQKYPWIRSGACVGYMLAPLKADTAYGHWPDPSQRTNLYMTTWP